MTSTDTFGLVTGSIRIFSSELPVSLIKKIIFHVSPDLKLTISLKIITKNYFQLNCTGKFSVAYSCDYNFQKEAWSPDIAQIEDGSPERDLSISHCTDFVFLSISTLF